VAGESISQPNSQAAKQPKSEQAKRAMHMQAIASGKS